MQTNVFQMKIITGQTVLALFLLVHMHTPHFLYKQKDLLTGFWHLWLLSLCPQK